MTPDDRRYAESHEWIKVDGDSAVVGITDHAQDSLGDITFVELPAIGTKLEQGRECGVIESVKAASDIYAPAGGDVAEINSELESSPERINESPYEKGWLFRLTGVDASDLEKLMDSAAYAKFLEEND
jgi:glycine cleavage system H protein